MAHIQVIKFLLSKQKRSDKRWESLTLRLIREDIIPLSTSLIVTMLDCYAHDLIEEVLEKLSALVVINNHKNENEEQGKGKEKEKENQVDGDNQQEAKKLKEARSLLSSYSPKHLTLLMHFIQSRVPFEWIKTLLLLSGHLDVSLDTASNVSETEQFTPLIYAINLEVSTEEEKKYQMDLIDALLSQGVDVNKGSTTAEWTPLMFAIKKLDMTLVERLICAGTLSLSLFSSLSSSVHFLKYPLQVQMFPTMNTNQSCCHRL